MDDRLAVLNRARVGTLEHIEWVGDTIDIPIPGNHILTRGARGSIIKVGGTEPGLFEIDKPSVVEGELLVLFEGRILARLAADGPWRPLALPPLATIKRELDDALQTLIDVDGALLRRDVAERTVTARLAAHLQTRFADWHVDCEYNRMIVPPGVDLAKYLLFRSKIMQVLEPFNVFPDVILHRRDSLVNLLVLEVKKASARNLQRQTDFDLEKLRAMCSQLYYKYGAFVLLKPGTEPRVEDVIWIMDA
jgi:hypothetical protein